jgi:hypothetical protein
MILAMRVKIERYSDGVGFLVPQLLCIAIYRIAVLVRDREHAISSVFVDQRAIAQRSRNRRFGHIGQPRDIGHSNRAFFHLAQEIPPDSGITPTYVWNIAPNDTDFKVIEMHFINVYGKRENQTSGRGSFRLYALIPRPALKVAI